ncbi:MAG: type II toxin-antitoxin system RelE/ParE family toxin [Flavobacteriales bacterium]|nr:type II toxin-antitoxin system RelE/ParE family toxin [Flavobacteriales bacterium]
MSFEVRSIAPFDRQAKRSAKKYPSLKKGLAALATALRNEPKQGSALGNGCYKVRMAITSKGRGRSGGARIVTHLAIRLGAVYLLSIYDKSEQATITDMEVMELVRQIPE